MADLAALDLLEGEAHRPPPLSISLSLSLEAFAPFVEEEGPADPSPVFLEPISPKPKASKTFQRSRRP